MTTAVQARKKKKELRKKKAEEAAKRGCASWCKKREDEADDGYSRLDTVKRVREDC